MTPSLVVAVNSGTMASRTTKSDIRMPNLLAPWPCARARSREARCGSHLFFAGFLAGAACHLTDGGRPPVVLDLFLVPADLGLKFVLDEVHSGQDVRVAFRG